MDEVTRGSDLALDLSRVVLAILDGIGASAAAIHVQHAIDIIVDARPLSSEAEMDAFLATPEGQALTAKAFAVSSAIPSIPR